MTDNSLSDTVRQVLDWFEYYHEGQGPILERGKKRAEPLCFHSFVSSVDGEENVSICLHRGAHVLLDALALEGVRVTEIHPDPDCEHDGHRFKAYLGWSDDTAFKKDYSEYKDKKGESQQCKSQG